MAGPIFICLHTFCESLNGSDISKPCQFQNHVSIGSPNKRVYSWLISLVTQPKYMLWVLKRTVSLRQFFWVPTTFDLVENWKYNPNILLKFWTNWSCENKSISIWVLNLRHSAASRIPELAGTKRKDRTSQCQHQLSCSVSKGVDLFTYNLNPCTSQRANILQSCSWGAQWLSGRVLDSRPKGRGFEPHRRHCVVVLEQDTFILA